MITRYHSIMDYDEANNNCECRADSSGFYFCPLHEAAPEMLEALKDLLNCCELNLDEMEPETYDTIERVQNLVAKAQGKENG